MAASLKTNATDTPGHAPIELSYLGGRGGLLAWLFTLDHKRIGVMYFVSVILALFLGGVFAILLRTELMTQGETIMEADTYNQMFTLHGAIMVFLFIIPAIPAAFGNFFLPIMLGAKDVAFPRLNLLSYHIYVLGAFFFLMTLMMGGLDTGWTFYTPYSTSDTVGSQFGGVIPATAGAFILGFSSILTGVNFIATIHMLRPPGMGWFQMPLFLWALYATSIIQILATPVLGITLLLLIAERAFSIGIFDPALGGDPVLYQHFFWFYSHPAVYIMILPAFGVISEMIGTHSHKHIFGYKFIAFSSLAIAFVGFFVWGHHMYTSGQSGVANIIFSIITMTIAVPSAIKVFNWLATMYKGTIDLNAPMLYSMSFIWVFAIGGLTGLFLAALTTDIHLHDTYFVVAHFHYVMVGGTLFAFLGAIHHWWPKMTGRMYHENLGRIAWFTYFLGFNLTFFVQFIMGSRGMPRRYYDYVEEFEFMHQVSTIGAYVTAIGLVLVLVCLIHSLIKGKPASANPWGGTTLEWHCTSPPPTHNFAKAPTVGDPYDHTTLEYDAETNTFYFIGEEPPTPGATDHHA
jgi:cytochrome c oxidase subunit 1